MLFGLLNVDWLIVKKASFWLREEKKKKTPKKKKDDKIGIFQFVNNAYAWKFKE